MREREGTRCGGDECAKGASGWKRDWKCKKRGCKRGARGA